MKNKKYMKNEQWKQRKYEFIEYAHTYNKFKWWKWNENHIETEESLMLKLVVWSTISRTPRNEKKM